MALFLFTFINKMLGASLAGQFTELDIYANIQRLVNVPEVEIIQHVFPIPSISFILGKCH